MTVINHYSRKTIMNETQIIILLLISIIFENKKKPYNKQLVQFSSSKQKMFGIITWIIHVGLIIFHINIPNMIHFVAVRHFKLK